MTRQMTLRFFVLGQTFETSVKNSHNCFEIYRLKTTYRCSLERISKSETIKIKLQKHFIFFTKGQSVAKQLVKIDSSLDLYLYFD